MNEWVKLRGKTEFPFFREFIHFSVFLFVWFLNAKKYIFLFFHLKMSVSSEFHQVRFGHRSFFFGFSFFTRNEFHHINQPTDYRISVNFCHWIFEFFSGWFVSDVLLVCYQTKSKQSKQTNKQNVHFPMNFKVIFLTPNDLGINQKKHPRKKGIFPNSYESFIHFKLIFFFFN